MVIKSPFKDYYDFVAKQYGGGDPRIVYTRTRLAPLIQYHGWTVENQFPVSVNTFPLPDPIHLPYRVHRRIFPRSDDSLQYAYLIAIGRAYGVRRELLRPSDPYRLLPLDWDADRPRWQRLEIEWGKEYPFLVDLCRKVGAPVFTVNKVDYLGRDGKQVWIDGDIPCLGELGMATLFSPQQMYQELAMFVGNRMKEPPDTEPPVELSNKQKIVKAGFDLVKSFRHRK